MINQQMKDSHLRLPWQPLLVFYAHVQVVQGLNGNRPVHRGMQLDAHQVGHVYRQNEQQYTAQKAYLAGPTRSYLQFGGYVA